MKHIIIFFFLAGFAGFQTISAQNRIATADREFVLSQMPEYKKMQSTLMDYSKKMQEKLAIIQEMIQDKEKIVQLAQQNNRPDLAAKQNELNTLISEFNSYLTEAEAALEARRNELAQPLFAKFTEAVRVVAVRKGYTHVADHPANGSGQFIYAPAEEDITSDVLRQMNISASYPPQ